MAHTEDGFVRTPEELAALRAALAEQELVAGSGPDAQMPEIPVSGIRTLRALARQGLGPRYPLFEGQFYHRRGRGQVGRRLPLSLAPIPVAE